MVNTLPPAVSTSLLGKLHLGLLLHQVRLRLVERALCLARQRLGLL
jgi:hypothetical protein